MVTTALCNGSNRKICMALDNLSKINLLIFENLCEDMRNYL